ncbi:MAG TPA: hypothetical protein VGA69_02325 [Nitriliruptorales bacterium]
MNARSLVEGLVNPFGRTLMGQGGLHGAGSHRLHRIGGLPSQFAHLRRRPGAPFTVDLDRVTTPCGFSYHPEGWHPYRATLAEYLAEPDLPYERSTLCRYYDRFQPTNVHEAILDHVSEPLEPLVGWPPLLELLIHLWALDQRRVRRLLQDPARSSGQGRRQELGPQTHEFGQWQVQRLLEVHASLARDGYRPGDHRDGAVTGYFLVHDDSYRFVVFHGNHRLAAFRQLGIQRIAARFHRAHPPVVNADDLERWTTRQRGVYPPDVAALLFQTLFTHRGDEKWSRLRGRSHAGG